MNNSAPFLALPCVKGTKPASVKHTLQSRSTAGSPTGMHGGWVVPGAKLQSTSLLSFPAEVIDSNPIMVKVPTPINGTTLQFVCLVAGKNGMH
jgi:hypothetical protein